MFIYAIQANAPHGPIKLGLAASVSDRLTKMQADNHETLTVVALWHGSVADERTVHAQFAAHKRRGEWFDLTVEQLAAVTLPSSDLPERRSVVSLRPYNPEAPTVGALITELGGPANLARNLGIYRGVPTTVHWPTRGIPSRYWHRIVDLAVAKGIQITERELQALPLVESAA